MKSTFFGQASVIAVMAFVTVGCIYRASRDRIVLDSFDDGVRDAKLWVAGGGARGWREDAPLGDGDWHFSHDEVVNTTGGYLRIRVWGPRAANTYGAEAWVRTVQDLNDGRVHVVNFTWEARPTIVGHGDYYFIQITDGFIPVRGDFHWPVRRPPHEPIEEADLKGTADLLVAPIGSVYSYSLWPATWAIS